MTYEWHVMGLVLVAGLGFGLATSGWLVLLAYARHRGWMKPWSSSASREDQPQPPADDPQQIGLRLTRLEGRMDAMSTLLAVVLTKTSEQDD